MTDIKERPILFSAPMVRAILEGRKTVTRRAFRVQPSGSTPVAVSTFNPIKIDRRGVEQPGPELFGAITFDGEWSLTCPFGQEGARLWVRETHADIGFRLTYRADTDDGAHCQVKKWTPAIHMFRRHSRILLEITDVRVERLQDITPAQVTAEGVSTHGEALWGGEWWVDAPDQAIEDARKDFADLWTSTGGNWDANPWVWVVEFKQVTP